eukprot:gnl/Chilomastix_caulleri/2250.p1 GENE.gnl/Chilomastix_caulleri/2250~~gnl/Chilomastix_caulleri/2250.p1  ORF type:complete len:159 (+),score=25.77 gnl/Chilomastix_caulleri/2250:232-708(+)
MRDDHDQSLDVSMSTGIDRRMTNVSSILDELQRVRDSLSGQLTVLDQKVTALNVELSEIRATTSLGGGVSSQTIPLSALDGYIDEKIRAATSHTTPTKSVATETDNHFSVCSECDFSSAMKTTQTATTGTTQGMMSSSHSAFLARLEDELRAIRSRIQ